MTVYEQIECAKDYLAKHPCKCSKAKYFHISFPYCSEGYACKTHCSLWFALYSIDFERLYPDDPNNSQQLTLF